ncbi:MAG TPA: hypothetical protein VMU24_02325 [Candidatus Acidoferrales bacterium]|nr:hypothetical protein [Candidatus Acidoferrales bacterium]
MTGFELGSLIIGTLQLLALIFAAGKASQMLTNHETRIGGLESWKDRADPQLNQLIGATQVRAD